MVDLPSLLEQQHSVTYRWYAQHFEVPVNTAKTALQEYIACRSGEVHAIFFIGGEAKEGG